jgi:hypothetical protein
MWLISASHGTLHTTLDEVTVLATVRHSALPYLGERRVHACAT